MEITKIYNESSDLTDFSKDKVIITMKPKELTDLERCLLNAKLFTNLPMSYSKRVGNLIKKLDNAHKKAKIKWVK